MGRCHRFLLLGSAGLALSACGAAASVVPTPEAVIPGTAAIAADAAGDDRSIEDLLADTPVTKARPRQPDLARADLVAILEHARRAHPRGRIRAAHLQEAFHSSKLLVRVVFEPHETGERVRRYHTVFLEPVSRAAEARTEQSPSEEPPNRWRLRDANSPVLVNLEICPPWRSFAAGLPPLADEITDLWFEPRLPEAVVLELVDSVRELVPPGERIWRFEEDSPELRDLDEWMSKTRARGAEVYEVETVRGCGGSIFRVEHLDGRWTAEHAGDWIS